jgi:DtxR family Mn-dependent transcriptional regulator
LKISECVQEQLEQLWISEVENGAALPAMPSLDSAYQELFTLGLAVQADQTIKLTADGKVEAANAIRRHRLAERLVVDVLVTDESLVDEQACNLEHALVDGIEESICTLLGHPRVCPHGKPIPAGRCCQQQRLTLGAIIAPLNDLKAGQEGDIAYLHMHNPQHLQKLMAMGVLPGAAVRVKSVYPSIVFEAGFSQFAVDEETAAEIYVRLQSAK